VDDFFPRHPLPPGKLTGVIRIEGKMLHPTPRGYAGRGRGGVELSGAVPVFPGVPLFPRVPPKRGGSGGVELRRAGAGAFVCGGWQIYS
jgi:hypothetical protein